jgi:hypothetical protein
MNSGHRVWVGLLITGSFDSVRPDLGLVSDSH